MKVGEIWKRRTNLYLKQFSIVSGLLEDEFGFIDLVMKHYPVKMLDFFL